jgi:hypothetical protein
MINLWYTKNNLMRGCSEVKATKENPQHKNLRYTGHTMENTTTVTEKSRRGRKPLTFIGFLSFADAKAYVQGLNITSIKAWNEWCKTDARPESVPAAPGLTYREDGWVGMPDFLGYTASGRGRPLGSKNNTVVDVVTTEVLNAADTYAASVVVGDEAAEVATGDVTTIEDAVLINLIDNIPDVVAEVLAEQEAANVA